MTQTDAPTDDAVRLAAANTVPPPDKTTSPPASDTVEAPPVGPATPLAAGAPPAYDPVASLVEVCERGLPLAVGHLASALGSDDRPFRRHELGRLLVIARAWSKQRAVPEAARNLVGPLVALAERADRDERIEAVACLTFLGAREAVAVIDRHYDDEPDRDRRKRLKACWERLRTSRGYGVQPVEPLSTDEVPEVAALLGALRSDHESIEAAVTDPAAGNADNAKARLADSALRYEPLYASASDALPPWLARQRGLTLREAARLLSALAAVWAHCGYPDRASTLAGPLAQALGTASSRTRLHAATGLVWLGGHASGVREELESRLLLETDHGVRAAISKALVKLTNVHKDDNFDRISPESVRPEAVEAEKYRIADEAINAVQAIARQQLELLLTNSVGRKYEEKDAEKAREAVRVVNHLASVGKATLYLNDSTAKLSAPVYLKCVTGKRQRSPYFQVCELGGSKDTAYSGRSFPDLIAKYKSES